VKVEELSKQYNKHEMVEEFKEILAVIADIPKESIDFEQQDISIRVGLTIKLKENKTV